MFYNIFKRLVMGCGVPRAYKASCATIMDIIFQDFLILYQIFFLPQVEWSMIISNKNGI